MKNPKPKFNIICHFPDNEEDMKELSKKISEIHTESVINQLNRLDIEGSDKIKVIDKVVELGQ